MPLNSPAEHIPGFEYSVTTRQWQEFDPHAEPIEVIDREGGKTDVKVHQLVKSLGIFGKERLQGLAWAAAVARVTQVE
jgi:hypothetical protein